LRLACSTPFGDQRTITTRRDKLRDIRRECSTPFGDQRTITYAEIATLAKGRECSTPFGDQRTITKDSSHMVFLAHCAQRLSAINGQSPRVLPRLP